MKLDPSTLILVAAISGLLLPLVLIGLSRSKETAKAVSTWTYATVSYAVGFVIILLRNQGTYAPLIDASFVVSGNVLVLLAYCEFYQGFRAYFQHPQRRLGQWFFALAYAVVLLVFYPLPDSFDTRVVIVSLFLGVPSAAISYELLRAGLKSRVFSDKIFISEHLVFFGFGAVFGANALFLFARGAIFMLVLQGFYILPDRNTIYAVSYLFAVLVQVLLAAGLPLLISRRVHRELASTQASLQIVQQVGRIAYAWLNAQTRVITGNDIFYQILGIPHGQPVLIEHWLSMVHPDDLETMRKAARLSERGVYFGNEFECRMLRMSDGQEVWISISSQVIPDSVDGRPLLLSVLRDITPIKRSELNAIQQKIDAVQLSDHKSRFLANMSHEIRTPINAILGMLSLLRKTALSDRQNDYVIKAHGATKGLLGLIDDILDFSKVGSGKMELENRPFSLDTLFRNLAVVLGPNLKGKNIDIVFDIDERLPPILVGDEVRLQQVITNLASNAIKFTFEGYVLVSLEHNGTSNEGICVGVKVKDTGIGIAPEHQKLVFEPFSQAESSTTRRFGGTGLGLAISKHLIELMGSTLCIESVLGEGSTFGFELCIPVPDASHLEVTHQSSDTADQRLQHALIIDDCAVAANVLAKQLRSMGWSTRWSRSGTDAIAVYEASLTGRDAVGAFSLVLIDLQLPDFGASGTLRELRRLAVAVAESERPFLMFTSTACRSEVDSQSDQYDKQLDAFLVKPILRSHLYDAVQDAHSQRLGIPRPAALLPQDLQLSGMRILLVEDNLLNQQVAQELLANEGAIVSIADNGQLALDALRSDPSGFDVVLMDIQMPVMDGIRATKLIRKELGLKDLPIVAMTANAMPSDRTSCLASGMNDHIGKPFDMQELVNLLRRVCGASIIPTEKDVSTTASDIVLKGTAELHGLDLQVALQRMANNRSLYCRTASDFLVTLESMLQDLKSGHIQSNYEQLRPRLHAVKSISGTLGLYRLSKMCAILENETMQWNDDEVISRELSKLAYEITVSASSIRSAIKLLQH